VQAVKNRKISTAAFLLCFVLGQFASLADREPNSAPVGFAALAALSSSGRVSQRGSEVAPSADGQLIENSVGLVVLSEDNREGDFIRFYNEDGSLWYEFSFYYDESGEFPYANEKFRPRAFRVDYFLMVLTCIKRDKGRSAVIVNEDTGLIKYVKAGDPAMKFENWPEHLVNIIHVGFDQKANSVRSRPEGPSVGEVPDREYHHPVKVRGEWLQIKWEVARVESRPKYAYGWIRWRRGSRLLVKPGYLC
jgi:hypothetical protein